jgi:hypothetical protein
MRNDDCERWPEDIDIDRVKASPRGIVGGWVVVAIIAALMLIGPPTKGAFDIALVGAKEDVVKVEHLFAQATPHFLVDCSHPAYSQPPADAVRGPV